MAGTGVGKFSSTAGSNTSNLTVNFAENMAPSNVNNAARELMGHIRDMYEQLGDGYFEFGDGDGEYTVARSDADTITITSSSDISSVYFAGRKIRITDGGANVVEGTIASSSHSSTTQTINCTGISLASGTPTKVEIGIDTAAFGGRVILDDDGDTYIEAPTDDTIDIYVAGAKDFVITANKFEVQGSSVIDMNGQELILDADADTSITADTDDQIDIRIAGADDFSFKANTLEVQSGSTIDMNGQELILDADQDTSITADTDDQIDLKAGGTDIMSLTATTVTINDGTTITTGDNTDTLTLKSTSNNSLTGPVLLFNRDSASPANDDFLGEITFQGDNSAGDAHDYGRIIGRILSTTDGSETVDVMVKDALGNNMINMQSGVVIFNDDSIDRDFRIESDGNDHMFFVDGGNNKVALGTSQPQQHLELVLNSTTTVPTDEGIGSANANAANGLGIHNESNSANYSGIAMETRTSGAGRFLLAQKWTATYLADLDFIFRFAASTSDEILKLRPSGAGEFYLGTAIAGEGENPVASNSTDAEGVAFFPASYSVFAIDSNPVMYLNRMGSDGIVLRIRAQGSDEGGLQVSGSTVSVLGFTGTHWSRLEDNSRPTILRGTILESIDKMMDWYQVVYTNANGIENKHNISLPDGAKVGDDYQIADPNFKETKYEEIDIFYTAEDGDTIPEDKSIGDRKPDTEGKNVGDIKDAKPIYTGKIVLEDDIKHTYSKVSDTADSKNIYGVFQGWDEDTEGDDDDVNDYTVAQVGTFVIRINKDVTVEAGDLLVSNGDGTAKLQDDDIIRSKTVAKVNSNVKIETYADGSYVVPCTLHC